MKKYKTIFLPVSVNTSFIFAAKLMLQTFKKVKRNLLIGLSI